MEADQVKLRPYILHIWEFIINIINIIILLLLMLLLYRKSHNLFYMSQKEVL